MQELKRSVDALVRLMEDWADWQKGYRLKLGYPSRSLTCYSESSQTFEDMCESVDSQTFATVDACVQDLLSDPSSCGSTTRKTRSQARTTFWRHGFVGC